MCCGKPTIAVIAMQKCHDNDKIEPHNHNEYPLLYKEGEILSLSLGRFLECQKMLHISYNTGTRALANISAFALGPMCTYQAMHSYLCYYYM